MAGKDWIRITQLQVNRLYGEAYEHILRQYVFPPAKLALLGTSVPPATFVLIATSALLAALAPTATLASPVISEPQAALVLSATAALQATAVEQ